jgi:hypothetical protein
MVILSNKSDLSLRAITLAILLSQRTKRVERTLCIANAPYSIRIQQQDQSLKSRY